MAIITTRTFSSLVTNIAAAMQSSAANSGNTVLNFSQGSVLRAIAEATAGMGLWIQALVLQLLTTTRLATCAGKDVDTFVGDYGLFRLHALAATGSVTFSRFTATKTAFVPVGTGVQTSDGKQGFTVVADSSNVSYSASLGGYTIPTGQTSVTITVQAKVAGSGGNVLSGVITAMTTSLSGIDTVTNTLAFSNGEDQESDQQLKSRFALYIQSLSKATNIAIAATIRSVQPGIFYTITEFQNYSNGNYDPGYFYVVVDDGTGSPPDSLITNVAIAVDANRAIGARFGVFAPQVQTASVTVNVIPNPGYSNQILTGQIAQAITDYINSLELGNSLFYSRLYQIAYNANPQGVKDVAALSVNGTNQDIIITNKQVIRSGTISASVSSSAVPSPGPGPGGIPNSPSGGTPVPSPGVTVPGGIAGQGYSLVFNEDFTSLSLDNTTWYKGLWNESTNPGFTPTAQVIQSGTQVELQWKTAQGASSPATYDTTIGTFNYKNNGGTGTTAWQYGYFEVRAKWDFVTGAWPQIWLNSLEHMQATDNYANGLREWGQIDLFAGQGSQANAFYGTVHDFKLSNNQLSNIQNNNNLFSLNNVDFTQFHTYGVLWVPGGVTWFFDNQQLMSAVTYNPAEEGQHFCLMLSSQAGNNFTAGQSAPSQCSLYVDWARVWQVGQ